MKRLLLAIVVVMGLAVALTLYPQSTNNMGRTLTGPLSVQYANEGVTGTTVNKLAKLTGAPSTAIIAATTDTSGIVGVVVSGAGTTGSAQIAFKGKVSCVFDSATTAGNYVINDTSTAGDCMDAGVTYPTSGQVIGVVTTTNGGAGTYVVDLTLGQPQAGGGGGGGASVIAIGSLPGTCTNGTTFNFTDSIYQVICNPANTFNYFYNTYPVVPPSSAGWTWETQGSSVISSTRGYVFLTLVDDSAGTTRGRYRGIPATPYTIEMGFSALSSWGNGVNGLVAGWRDSTGKLVTIQFVYSGATPHVVTGKWTNATTYTADYLLAIGNNGYEIANGGKEVWVKLVDSGVNISFFIGVTQRDYIQFDIARSRTDFMAAGPNGIYWGGRKDNATNTAGFALIHYSAY